MNDAHIFCTPDQIRQEFIGATQLILDAYRDLRIEDFSFRLSLRDEDPKYMGSAANWNEAQDYIREALTEVGHPFIEVVGEAAFYGPKLDVQIRDAMGREFTASTTQLDFLLPERFGLQYIDADGKPARPAMIHRAPLGTMERLMAFLIEHFGGDFPLWLAPVQLVVVPVADSSLDYAYRMAEFMRARDLRVEVDSRPERMQAKIRDSELQKVPFIGVVGKRDEEAETISLRERHGGDRGPMAPEAVSQLLLERVSSRA